VVREWRVTYVPGLRVEEEAGVSKGSSPNEQGTGLRDFASAPPPTHTVVVVDVIVDVLVLSVKSTIMSLSSASFLRFSRVEDKEVVPRREISEGGEEGIEEGGEEDTRREEKEVVVWVGFFPVMKGGGFCGECWSIPDILLTNLQANGWSMFSIEVAREGVRPRSSSRSRELRREGLIWGWWDNQVCRRV